MAWWTLECLKWRFIYARMYLCPGVNRIFAHSTLVPNKVHKLIWTVVILNAREASRPLTGSKPFKSILPGWCIKTFKGGFQWTPSNLTCLQAWYISFIFPTSNTHITTSFFSTLFERMAQHTLGAEGLAPSFSVARLRKNVHFKFSNTAQQKTFYITQAVASDHVE